MKSYPLPLSTPRPSDYVRSGLLNGGEDRVDLRELAVEEAVRLLSGKPGDYHTAVALRRYPYGVGCITLGRKKSKIIPRLYFSKHIERGEHTSLPYNYQLRYDYEARFPFGWGQMATDEDNRVIEQWSPTMEKMSAMIWKEMKKDKRFRSLCKAGNQFNHCSVHAYRNGAAMKKHKDRNNSGYNSMKEGTAVAVVTVGNPRTLSFFRHYNGKCEEEACASFEQEHGAVFILDPRDEVLRCRRDAHATRRPDACFYHGVEAGKGSDYFSIAFLFRCLDKTAVVDALTDRVIPPPPQSNKENVRRIKRRLIRKMDDESESEFNKTVAEVKEEWIRLMKNFGWL